MKLEKTLISSFTALFLFSFNVYSAELSEQSASCTQALSQGNLVKAVEVASEILKADAKNRDGLLCQGRALAAQGKYAEALIPLEKSLAQATGFDAIISHLLIGNLHKDNKKNAEALASYEKSIGISKQEKNDKFTRINHNLMGEVYANTQDFNAALTNYVAGEKLAYNDNERADSYERLATTYSALGRHNEAIEFQVKAILMQKKSGTLDQYANASLEMGRIYIAAKELQNAERTYTKLVQFSQENGGTYYEVKANMGLAQTKLAAGDAAAAKTLLINAQKLAKTVGADDLTAEVNTALAKLN
ncbi:MAG: tetratricopeptide repeat protein [Pseudomonadota bacterium]